MINSFSKIPFINPPPSAKKHPSCFFLKKHLSCLIVIKASPEVNIRSWRQRALPEFFRILTENVLVNSCKKGITIASEQLQLPLGSALAADGQHATFAMVLC